VGWQSEKVVSLFFFAASLKTTQTKDSHKIFAIRQKIEVGLCSKWARSNSVETKWSHDVPMSWRCFSAPQKSDLACLVSLFHSPGKRKVFQTKFSEGVKVMIVHVRLRGLRFRLLYLNVASLYCTRKLSGRKNSMGTLVDTTGEPYIKPDSSRTGLPRP